MRKRRSIQNPEIVIVTTRGSPGSTEPNWRRTVWGKSHTFFIIGFVPRMAAGHTVIEDVEDRVDNRVIRRKVIKTDDPQYPRGYRHSLHYGYTDGQGTTLRYDNENEMRGQHERHTADEVTRIAFPGMMALRDRFIKEIKHQS